jgi:hypothetical protein
MDVKSLPKDPMEALKATVEEVLSFVGKSNATFGNLRENNHPIAAKLVIASTISKRVAARIDDEDVRNLVQENLRWEDEDALHRVREKAETALELITSLEIDDHFIQEDDIELFDEAELDQDEKNEIRQLMADARVRVDRSNTLKKFQKRNVLFHIAKIENELHREKSHFQTFIAAAYQISGLAKQVGEDVQPIADAVEKARTITEKKVEGQLQIEKEQEPKQLEHHQDD